MRYICTSIVATLGLASTVCGQGVQWTEEGGGEGHWYAGFQCGSCTSVTAEAMATQMGGHLVSISSQEEAEWLRENVASDPDLWSNTREGPWIGAVNLGKEWEWLDGSEWSYENWWTDNPDNGVPADVSLWELNQGGLWQDHPYGQEHYSSFIVEWSADCNGDGLVDYGQILEGQHLDCNDNGIIDECEFDVWQGHWYAGFQCGSCTSVTAEAMATQMGGHLVSISSQEEAEWLRENVASDPDLWSNTREGPWIGAVNLGKEWEWLDGSEWSYENWWTDNPDNGVPADVSLWELNQGGLWQDHPYGQEHYSSFIVEWSADCNGDGLVDYAQILCGLLEDADGNGVPDCCQDDSCRPCEADINLDGEVDITDLLIVIGEWGQTNSDADIDNDGLVEVHDLLALLSAWGPCP